MTSATAVSEAPPMRPSRRQLLPNGVLGMGIFVVAEVMFFAGLISAHSIVKMGTLGGIWPPPGQPRLPIEATMLNTAALLVSGALLAVGLWRHGKKAKWVMPWVGTSLALGIGFVALQGREWVALIAQGLTLTSSTHGSFFYLIVGAHGVHAAAGLIALAFLVWNIFKSKATAGQVGATGLYWYFVVLLWPVLYMKVYL